MKKRREQGNRGLAEVNSIKNNIDNNNSGLVKADSLSSYFKIKNLISIQIPPIKMGSQPDLLWFEGISLCAGWMLDAEKAHVRIRT